MEGKVSMEGFQVWYSDGSRMDTSDGADAHRQGDRVSVSVFLGGCVSMLQAEVGIHHCSVFQNGDVGRSCKYEYTQHSFMLG